MRHEACGVFVRASSAGVFARDPGELPDGVPAVRACCGGVAAAARAFSFSFGLVAVASCAPSVVLLRAVACAADLGFTRGGGPAHTEGRGTFG